MIVKQCLKFAQNIKKIREEKELNKARLSELTGCDISYIGKIERGEKFPNLKMIFKLAQALDVAPAKLFDFEE